MFFLLSKHDSAGCKYWFSPRPSPVGAKKTVYLFQKMAGTEWLNSGKDLAAYLTSLNWLFFFFFAFPSLPLPFIYLFIYVFFGSFMMLLSASQSKSEPGAKWFWGSIWEWGVKSLLAQYWLTLVLNKCVVECECWLVHVQ